MNKPLLISIVVLISACAVLAFLWQSADKRAVKLSGDLGTMNATMTDLASRYDQLEGQANATIREQKEEISRLKEFAERSDQATMNALNAEAAARDEHDQKRDEAARAISEDEYAADWEKRCLPAYMRNGRLCDDSKK